jgi:molybdenum cofactor cytidylyltransferase
VSRVAAIILAAGDSTRMGTQKLLLPVGNERLIQRVVRTARDSQLDPIVVVTGRDHDALAPLIHGVAIVVRNLDPSRGMLSSVRVALEALPEDVASIILFLGDQPACDSRQVRALVHTNGRIVVPTFDGRRGHPMKFSMEFRDEILARYDDAGLRGLLRAHASEVIEVPIDDPGVLIDVDTPEEYEAELRRLLNPE